MLVLIDNDLGNFRGRERATNQLGLIIGPWHDIYFLAAQFLYYRLHSRSLHSNACTYRIHIGVLRIDRNLGPAAGLARALANLDDAFIHLRNFLLEQLDQESVGGAREHDGKSLF